MEIKEKKRRKSASKWDHASEIAFIAIWERKMDQLRTVRKNSHILAEMAEELEKKGFSYTVLELKTKMHNLTARYRREVRLIRTTGESEWDLFDDMGNLLEPNKTFNMENLGYDSMDVDVYETKPKRRIKWSEEAEHQLLDIWQERYSELKDSYRNLPIFEQIVSEMAKKGYPMTINEVKCKLHNLKNRYRAERKQSDLQSKPSTWPLFERVQDIVGKDTSYDFESSDCNAEPSTSNFSFVEAESISENILNESGIDQAVGEHDLFMYELTKLNAENRESLRKELEEERQEEEKERQKKERQEKELQKKEQQKKEMQNTKKLKNDPRNDDMKYADYVCLDRMASTVNDVVQFIMKTEIQKSRNDPFLKVLDSYLLQLPDETQDAIKIEILNTVFNKTKVLKCNQI